MMRTFQDNVKIGFVGVGSMGQCAHLRNYVCVEGCEVVALAELRPELGKKVAECYGVKRVYGSHREMLAAEKLDAIVAIQPFQMHGRLVPDLLAYGRPVLIEKPIARSVEAGEKILTAQSSGKAKLYIGYHKRCDPAVMWAGKQIAQWKQTSEMGAMKLVRITMPPGDWQAGGFSSLITTDEKYPSLEKDPSPAGMDAAAAGPYEAFVNYYIHQVNLMRHLMGESYCVKYADPSGVLMAVQSESGVAGVLEMGPYRTTRDWQEIALVTFERGWIRIDIPPPLAIDRAGRVAVFEDEGNGEPRTIVPEMPHIHAMRQQAAHFVAATRGEQTCLCEAEEALEDLRIARDYIEMQRNRSKQ
jgi:predicted dehydrogenase